MVEGGEMIRWLLRLRCAWLNRHVKPANCSSRFYVCAICDQTRIEPVSAGWFR